MQKTLTFFSIIILCVAMTSCPNKDKTGVDWSQQPHLRADITDTSPNKVPPVFGKWMKNPTYYINYDQIYLSEPDNPAPPDTLAKINLIVPPIANSFIPYAANYGLKATPSTSIETADIVFRFYYGRYPTADDNIRQVQSVEDLTNINFYIHNLDVDCVDGLLVGNKGSSAIENIPRWESGYLGVALPKISKKNIYHVDVWLNVYIWQNCLDAEAYMIEHYPETNYDTVNVFKSICRQIVWHEFGHAFLGLYDDTVGNDPGMMVYKNMTETMAPREEDVVRWLYQ